MSESSVAQAPGQLTGGSALNDRILHDRLPVSAAGACGALVDRAVPAANSGANPRTLQRERLTLVIKWLASLIQIAGYGLTAFGLTPWNLYFFLAGVLGWFAVGVLWKDRAIMLIHVVALGAMIAGMSR